MSREQKPQRENVKGEEAAVPAAGRRSLVASRYPTPAALAQALDNRGGATGEPTIHDAATAAVEHKDAGAAVDPGVAARVGAHLGTDFSSVRVHSDPLARQATAAMGARAFAHGADVFLGPGESGGDLGLMAHELTHVAQQGAAGQRAVQRRVEVGDTNSPAEREADQVAAEVTGGQGRAASLLVDDLPLGPGQMLKSQFLEQLRAEVTAAADAELGPVYSAIGCPYIEQYFGRYAGQPAASSEALLQRYAPTTRTARTAAEMIPTVVARVREGVRTWRDTGRAPADIAAAEPAAAQVTPGQGAGAPTGMAKRAEPDGPSIEPGSPADVAAQLGTGQPLDSTVAAHASDAYGADLGGVRVHTGATAARLAADRGAHAFTVGRDIAFAAGAYQPNTPYGDALIAHELAHVVQQDGQPAALQPKRTDGEQGDAYEAEADQAATGFLSRVYGGLKNAVRRMPSLRRGPALQLNICSGGGGTPPIPVPADPYLARLHAKLHATPRDLAGFYADIEADARGHAGNAGTRRGFETFITDRVLSRAESMRAIALQELGAPSGWHEAVRNFVQGVEGGVFTISVLPPAGADPLREFCILRAGQTAEGTADLKANYRNSFDSRWDSSRFSAETVAFNPDLTSKGPRNNRARAIFNELYADPAFHTAYDTNTPAGFRDLCDTHAGPDNVNLIASPRIQELRALLNPPVVTAASTGDAAYTALIAAVTPKAQALDARDRREIEGSHPWRQAVDAKVNGTTPAIAHTLREDLWSVVTTSRPAGPGAAPVAPVPVGPVPVPNAGQTAFLSAITLTAPGAQIADTDDHPLPFQVRAPAPGNPGLAVRRRLVLTPASQVNSPPGDDAWANTATNADHTAQVNPEHTGPLDPEHPVAGQTVFTAHLTMPPLSTTTFPERTATVTVTDHRLEWFKNNIQLGALYTNDTRRTYLNAGNVIHYHGGQMTINVTPELAGAAPNPNLDIEMEGDIKKGGASVFAMSRKPFGRRTASEHLGHTNLLEPSPAPAAPENFSIEVRFYQGSGAAAAKTLTMPFKIGASVATPGGDAALMTGENNWLNTPIATAGGLLHHMDTAYGAGSIQQRVARAVASGAFILQACTIRSDSRAAVLAQGGNPAERVAYALGAIDPIGPSMPNTLVRDPGADWWRSGGGVFLITRDSLHSGPRKPLPSLAQGLTHEGIHAVDRNLPAAVPGDSFPDYVAEFRSYWVEGRGAALSTAFDPAMDNRGPKSRRSRDIFDFLYTELHALYPFVKFDYDSNANGFRDRVNDYIYPDGINLILSGPLTALRTEIESYTGVVATFPAKRAAIVTRYAALIPGTHDAELREIHGNRDWRDLVESKFTTAAHRTDIKGILGIPT